MFLRLLHLADVRLGSAHAYAGDQAERRRRDVEESFKAAADFALDPARRIDLVLVSGDLFDARKPDADAFALARGVFARLAASGVGVVVLPGYHDASSPDGVWRSEKFAGATTILSTAPEGPITLDVRGTPVHVYGVAYRRGRTPVPFRGFDRVEAEGFHVGLLHGMVDGHPEQATRPYAWSFDAAALDASRLDYVALGGAHGGGEYRFEHGGAAAYAGPIEGLGFDPGDLGRKALLVVELRDGEVSFERTPISRGVIVDETIDLAAEGIRDVEALRAAMFARGGEDVVARFKLVGVREFLCRFDEALASVEDRFRHATLVDASTFEDSLLVRRIAAEGTIRGFFVRRMQKRLASLRERLPHRRDAEVAEREIRVAERALTLGLEQFVEADAGAAEATPKAARKTVEGAAPPGARIGGASKAPRETPADEIVLEEGA